MNLDEYARMYAAEDTHWWYVGMRQATLGLLNGYVAADPGLETRFLQENGFLGAGTRLRILDAGCGTGGLLPHLAAQGWAAGVDLSSTALGFARQRGLTPLAQASVETLPFASATFDVVTCMDVLYHLQVHEDVAALREFHRVLRPGGWLLVKVPALETLRGQHDRTVHTRHRYTVAELREKLVAARFRVERATYANTLLLPLAAAKRAAEHLLPIAAEGSSDVTQEPGWLNAVLTRILSIEAHLVQHIDLPVGVSAIALAQRE
jgi:SAM-dependent methyltransferase